MRWLLSTAMMLFTTLAMADDRWPIEMGVDVKGLLNTTVGKQFFKTFAKDADKMIAEAEEKGGFRPDKVVFVSGGYAKLEGPQSLQRPPFVVIELGTTDEVTAAVAKRKMTEVLAKGTIPGFPNAVGYKPVKGGPHYVVDGSSFFVNEPEGDLLAADAANAFKNHVAMKQQFAKSKCHQYLRVDGAVMNMVKQNALPPEAESFKPLLNSTGYTMQLTITEKLSVDLRGTFVDEKDAGESKDAVEQALALASVGLNFAKGELEKKKDSPKNWKQIFDMVSTLRKGAKPKLDGTTLIVTSEAAIPESLVEIISEAMGKTGEAAGRMQSQNNLKQMALGVHNYHDSLGTMPMNIYSTGDKPKALLSWRVHLLPYLEQDALYREFKLDEAWDSETNKKLIAKMPKTYLHPKAKETETGVTYYRAFAPSKKGDVKCLFPAFPGEKWGMAGITDGLSNTIMFGEAADAVIWTKPDSLLLDPAGKLPRMGGIFPGGFNVALGDGSVRFVKESLAEATLKAMITANGGEVFTIDD